MKIHNASSPVGDGVHWFKTCNAQTALVYTKYPTSGANEAAHGGGVCKFPMIYRGRVHMRCIADGMPFRWCYHDDGTWGECDLSYLQNSIVDRRPHYVATIQSAQQSHRRYMSSLGAMRIIAATLDTCTEVKLLAMPSVSKHHNASFENVNRGHPVSLCSILPSVAKTCLVAKKKRPI